jgi:hypothetical protein
MTEREATDWDERLWEAAIDLGRLARDRMGEAGDLITPADLRRLGLGVAPTEELAAREALATLTDVLGGVEFRANVFGLTCTQDDARRIAAAVDNARAALASPPGAATAKPASEVAVGAQSPDAAGTVER